MPEKTAGGLVTVMAGLPKELHTWVVSVEPLAQTLTPTPPTPGHVAAVVAHAYFREGEPRTWAEAAVM